MILEFTVFEKSSFLGNNNAWKRKVENEEKMPYTIYMQDS